MSAFIIVIFLGLRIYLVKLFLKIFFFLFKVVDAQFKISDFLVFGINLKVQNFQLQILRVTFGFWKIFGKTFFIVKYAE